MADVGQVDETEETSRPPGATEVEPQEVFQEPGELLLPRGEALSIEEATDVARGRKTRLVLLAGSVGSGKTTLVSSIYEAFSSGPFAGFLFAGSRTLIGFEERCHLGRIASKQSAPDTEHTRAGPTQFLHLCLKGTGAATDLLITDLSGEIFRNALNSTDECRRLTILRRADVFSLLIDAGRLASTSERHQAKAEALLLLRSCVEADMLHQRSVVDVVFSKWDLIDKSESYASEIEAEIAGRFATTLGELRFVRVAARPVAESDVDELYGVDGLLDSWMIDATSLEEPASMSSYWDVKREFDRFPLKQMTR